MSSYLLLQQYPACLVRLTWIYIYIYIQFLCRLHVNRIMRISFFNNFPLWENSYEKNKLVIMNIWHECSHLRIFHFFYAITHTRTHTHTHIYIWELVCPHSVNVNVLEFDIIESDFEIKWCYNVSFCINNLGKIWTPLFFELRVELHHDFNSTRMTLE